MPNCQPVKNLCRVKISLLIGEEGNPLSSQEVLEGGESLILSEVAEPPAQMIDSLTTLFKTIKPVKRAFICSIKENEEAQPNLLIGIEADGDIEEIIQAAGSVATDTLPGDEPIDICQVKKERDPPILLPNILRHSMNVVGVVFCVTYKQNRMI